MLHKERILSDRRDIERDSNGFPASLTIEAAFVMPIFLFAMLAFLYFIQLFTMQEIIQAAITKMGLNMAKTAYVYQDFAGIEEVLNFDESVFGAGIEIGLGDLAKSVVDETILKLYAKKYLDEDRINHSCILGGFDGISFRASKILIEEDAIDIVVQYRVRFPIQLFSFDGFRMLQRVRVRAWTGYEVAALYHMEEEEEGEAEMVYITETGSVYHRTSNCSHIRLSISAIQGLPTTQRNSSGGKYYPCEKCCLEVRDPYATFYITSEGTRYHSNRDCSKIKRSVKKIPLSEVGSRPVCKRCGG